MIDYQEKKHNQLVNILLNEPQRLGLEEDFILHREKEHELWYEGRVYVKPDLFFETLRGNIYVEVKSSCSKLCLEKAQSQLFRMAVCLKDLLPDIPYNLGLAFPRGQHQTVKKMLQRLEVVIYDPNVNEEEMDYPYYV